MDFKSGGKAIQILRKQLKMTQEQLAEKANLTSNTVSRIERGLLMPSVPSLCDICNALNCNADIILAAYIKADSQIRWSPLAEQMQKLPEEKQNQIETILNCLIETL